MQRRINFIRKILTDYIYYLNNFCNRCDLCLRDCAVYDNIKNTNMYLFEPYDTIKNPYQIHLTLKEKYKYEYIEFVANDKVVHNSKFFKEILSFSYYEIVKIVLNNKLSNFYITVEDDIVYVQQYRYPCIDISIINNIFKPFHTTKNIHTIDRSYLDNIRDAKLREYLIKDFLCDDTILI